MAKIGLRDTVADSEIVRLGEIKNKPNYKIDENYGITGGESDYALVKKRLACRTGTAEDGINAKKIIEYEMWDDDFCYVENFVKIFRAYAKKIKLTEFKTKKMNGDIKELIEIEQKTNDMINEALKGIDQYLNKEQEEVCVLADTKERLKIDISELQQQKKELASMIKNINVMYEEIKDKHKLVMSVDKPRNHKMPKEKE